MIIVVSESVIFTAKFIYSSYQFVLIIVVPKGFVVLGHDSIVIILWERKVELKIWDEEYHSNSTSLKHMKKKSNDNDNFNDCDTDN